MGTRGVEDPARSVETGTLSVLVYADMRTHHAQMWVAGARAAGIKVRTISSMAPDRTPTSGEITSEDAMGDLDVVAKFRKFVVNRGLNRRVRAVFQARAGRVDVLQVFDTVLALIRRRKQVDLLVEAYDAFHPDVVHALRLPYEGLICAGLGSRRDVAISVSTWGQDLRFQAPSDPLMRTWLRRVMPAVDGVHVDAAGDYTRAIEFGLRAEAPHILAAGNFGVDRDMFFPEEKDGTVLYPRGVRRYVNHRAFLELVVHHRGTGVRFIGVGLETDPDAVRLAADTRNSLRLTPELARIDYAPLVRRASVVVSPARSDGTPNSILEAVACGAVAIAGDIEPVRDLRNAGLESIILADPDDLSQWRMDLTGLIATAAARPEGVLPLKVEFDREANKTRLPAFLGRVHQFHETMRRGSGGLKARDCESRS